jgi:hypothetical protein
MPGYRQAPCSRALLVRRKRREVQAGECLHVERAADCTNHARAPVPSEQYACVAR